MMQDLYRRVGILAVLSTCGSFAFAQQAELRADAGSSASERRELRGFLDKYCIACHNVKAKTAGLLLDKADVSNLPERPDLWEKVIRKLRAGSMPPQGMPQPGRAGSDGIASLIENTLDRFAAANPNPGRPLIHRLNRTEYANAVRDLLGVQVDVESILPADSSSFGFDNNAGSLTVSPVLLEKYLAAADQIGTLALGDPKAEPAVVLLPIPIDRSQNQRMEGMPLGTSGGTLVRYNFPADGEYVLKGALFRPNNTSDRGTLGQDHPEYFEITVDGKRVLLTHFGGKDEEWDTYKNYTGTRDSVAQRMTVKTFIKAGVHAVGFTFINRKLNAATAQRLYRPYRRSSTIASEGGGPAQLESVTISGPYNSTGVSDTESRRKILICRPAPGTDELPCARKIVSSLARRAFRRPVADADVETLLGFYQRGRNKGTFDDGIKLAISATLTSPYFLFRTEVDPPNASPNGMYRVSDLELASRVAFFLWSSIPDDELLNIASQGKLKDPGVLEQQVRRMLADRRSHELVSNFTGQWLGLRALPATTPDKLMFWDFDDHLREGFRTETEMLFESILREDRNVLDLLNADYTFVNERLAHHYGIPNVFGEEFRRVPVTDEQRRGLLGHASILTISSAPTRTSPVKRGKWLLTTLLSIPPPPPPPNVPPLADNSAGAAPRSVRERMEQHRSNPACAVCHKIIDPPGFSLENFNSIGEWRSHTEDGKPVDASGVLWDGTKVAGPADLRKAILSRPSMFLNTVTERLLTYALGRGVDDSEMPVVRAINREAAKNGYRLSFIIMGIVKSTPFQMRSGSAAEQEHSAALALQRGSEPGIGLIGR